MSAIVVLKKHQISVVKIASGIEVLVALWFAVCAKHADSLRENLNR